MPPLHFHLHERGTTLVDHQGLECAALPHAMEIAIAAARDIIVGEVRAGHLDMNRRIAITDASSQELGSVRFPDAVAITPYTGDAEWPHAGALCQAASRPSNPQACDVTARDVSARHSGCREAN